jgi:hypothetical protein
VHIAGSGAIGIIVKVVVLCAADREFHSTAGRVEPDFL